MSMSQNQKMKLLILWDLLQKNSDEDNPLSTNEIVAQLRQKGIVATRKAIYEDIRDLNEFGYEVLTARSRSNMYYVVDRSFDEAELRILLDAVSGASFISEKKTKELTEKIAALAGESKAEVLKKNVVYTEGAKHSNEKIYYSVDTIDRAIAAKKKVGFRYFDLDARRQRQYRIRTDGSDRYLVNPVSLIFNENKYYLTCYDDKYKNLANYRIDKMDDVRISDEDITPADCVTDFNANKHRKQAFSMYIGELKKVTIAVKKNKLDVIYDKFGEDTRFYRYGKEDGDTFKFRATVQVSPAFFAWCAQLGEDLWITEPKEVVDEYRSYLEKILNAYQNRKETE